LKNLEEVRAIVEQHESWRRNCLNLIASENQPSRTVRNLEACDFMNRYATFEADDPNVRKYRGLKYIIEAENLAIGLAKSLFQAEHADLRPISGTMAGLAVIFGATTKGDLVMETGVEIGSHLVVKKFLSSNIVDLRLDFLPSDVKSYNVEIDRAIKDIRKKRPKLVILGSSNFLFPHPVKEIKPAVEEVNGCLAYDASHVLGLLSGKKFQAPFKEGADIVFGGTNKTFPGPQGGIILAKKADLSRYIRIYPNLIDNHHLGRIPALACALIELMEFGEQYAEQVITNARTLGEQLTEEGFKVPYEHLGFTDSHTILMDVSEYGGGKVAAALLERSNIIVNTTTLPIDVQGLKGPSGIRLGTQEMTRFGMKKDEMREIATLMRKVLIEKKDPERIGREAQHFRSGFQKLQFSFDKS